MSWTCYNCSEKIPNSADVCPKCGGTVAAPSSFYVHWIFGAAAFFFIFYLTGTLAGGVIIESVAKPEDSAVLAAANAARGEETPQFSSLADLEADQITAAKAIATQKSKEQMSPIIKGLLFWIFPVVLFVLCGIIVGFVSDGKTIIEAGAGSILGQIGGFMLLKYSFDNDLGMVTLIVGSIIGAGLGFLGAWLGEIIQENKERAGGITG